jgi:hypothetical protein
MRIVSKLRVPTCAALIVGLALEMFGGQGAIPSSRLRTLKQRIDLLQAGVHNAESIRAIKRLQNAYGHYAELGLWNDFADLFSDQAVGYYPAGRLQGRQAIHQLFFDQVGRGKLGLDDGRIYPHIMLQPVITLAPDGQTARGRWRVLAMLGGYGSSASWTSGLYENAYVLENDVWKISELRYDTKVSAQYDAAGWKDAGVKVPIHFDGTSAGRPPDATGRSTTDIDAEPDLTSLGQRIARLTQRAARLNDQAEVTNLQNIYGYYADRKLWDQVADLFSSNATMELGLQGVYAGRASIRRALNQFGPPGLREGELNDHIQLQIIVTVAPDGRTAKARGVDLIMSSAPSGRDAELTEGIFENEYVKQDGVWRIQALHFYPRFIADAGQGWAKSAKPAPGPSKEFPPDRPPTSTYEIYPKFSIAPFHFVHPVTGRPAQYPPGVPAGHITETASATVATSSVRTVAELEASLVQAARMLAKAQAYDAAENLVGAHGYYVDESLWDDVAKLFAKDRSPQLSDNGRATPIHVAQIIQPVIHIAADGKSAKIRVRLLELGGTSGGDGSWTAGVYEDDAVNENGVWKFKSMNLDNTWSAPYRGGWARASVQKVHDSFHYKNPVTGRATP